MKIRERMARWIAPSLRNESEIRELVAAEVKRARMALPISANYDPKGEGYRRLMGGQRVRDLSGTDQGRMFEVAYFMWDNSAMTRGMAMLDKGRMLKVGRRAEFESIRDSAATGEEKATSSSFCPSTRRVETSQRYWRNAFSARPSG